MIPESSKSVGWVQTTILLLLALVLTSVIFIVDLNVSSNVAIGPLYSIVILYGWLLPGKRTPVLVGLFCSILVLWVIAHAPEADPDDHSKGINCMISLVVIWVSALLVIIAQRGFEGLMERTAQLKQSEERLTQMTEDVSDYAIFLLDPEGKVESWNLGAKNIQGYSSEEIIGRNFAEFFTPRDRKRQTPAKLLKDAASHGQISNERWMLRKNGDLYWGSFTITALVENDQLIGFTTVALDLTKRKRAEEALEQHALRLANQNKELEQFTYVASHDLQEPLRTITSFTDLLQKEYRGQMDEKANKYLDFMSDAANRMSQLIKGLLDYGRVGAQRELISVNAATIIKEVQQDLSSMIEESQTTISIGELPELKVYDTEFRLLFQNLISNAIKFRKPGKPAEITIKATDEKDHWLFSVKDNGIGILPEHKNKIFVIFQRLHHRQAYEGTGIGLSHCRKIVELHNGSIWVDSEPEKGSIFYFTISKQIA